MKNPILVPKNQKPLEEKEKLSIYVVYNKPKDFPEEFVVRRFEMDKPREIFAKSKNIEEIARKLQRLGLVKMMPCEEDDPAIMEIWL